MVVDEFSGTTVAVSGAGVADEIAPIMK